ncbi:rhodanese-like domain-containing protein [Virgibacillus sp. 7505]|uniref:rhodanese-like domain-containing protein n=1 Tax=Virgibacillus sp. 7505 TaxID=2022548 RepID=UPI000BA7CD4C|nr:rhodanese-like domain-containing protein [Virgibacillus sp. 7505]PAE15059.1 rhodanese-like domain-containing protein [Virgibacillus sp. 7505]
MRNIQPEELDELIENGTSSYKVIDVREDEEVEQGMIPGAIHIPLQQIPEKLPELPMDDTYVLVCRGGHRSMNAAAFMENQGYDVINMDGGMLEWKGELVFK